MENSKKLSFSQRITIENLLNQRKRKFEIANELDVCNKTINECYDSALKKLRKFFLAHPEFVNYFPGLKK